MAPALLPFLYELGIPVFLLSTPISVLPYVLLVFLRVQNTVSIQFIRIRIRLRTRTFGFSTERHGLGRKRLGAIQGMECHDVGLIFRMLVLMLVLVLMLSDVDTPKKKCYVEMCSWLDPFFFGFRAKTHCDNNNNNNIIAVGFLKGLLPN
jgi:hypothetical protein